MTGGFSACLCSPPGTGFPCSVSVPSDLLQRGFDKPRIFSVCQLLSFHCRAERLLVRTLLFLFAKLFVPFGIRSPP